MRVPSPDWTAQDIVAHLRTLGSAGNVAGMARFGIRTDRALGVGNTDIRSLARKVKRNHARALALWRTGCREARLMAGFTAEPARLTPALCRRWAADFDSWEIVDCLADLFVEATFWHRLIDMFAGDEREFVRRAAFAMMAQAAVHRKTEPDATFLAFLPLIEAHAADPRNFVRKAVNWALRQIGKRSLDLHAPALALAERLGASGSRPARWIGRDAARELTAEKTVARIAAKAQATSREAPPSLSSTM
jgi:3-methyladenine DNA glycosylase AlkD